MFIKFYTFSQNNQTGLGSEPRHLAHNPLNPLTCIGLSMGVQAVIHGHTVGRTQSRIFKSESTTKNFQAALKRFVVEHNGDPGIKGIKLVIHSLKKTLMTLLNGTCSAPVTTSTILLRVGKKLGEPEQRYMFLQPGQDKTAAHLGVGKDVDSSTFAQGPCHFKDNSIVTDYDIRLIFDLDKVTNICE